MERASSRPRAKWQCVGKYLLKRRSEKGEEEGAEGGEGERKEKRERKKGGGDPRGSLDSSGLQGTKAGVRGAPSGQSADSTPPCQAEADSAVCSPK